MNNHRGIMKNLLIAALSLTAAASMIFLAGSNTVAEERLEAVQTAALLTRSLARINDERQASIEKTIKIISRYNRTMPDSLKRAIAEEIYLMTCKYPALNVDFICATITHESAKTWDPTVVSRVGAMGLMQVMPATGAFLAVEEGIPWTTPEEVLFDPILNIRLGCRYLSEMVSLYRHDGGLAAYNGGPKRAEMWIAGNRNDQILWEETRRYVPAVLELYDKFRQQNAM